jgi:hypothetical protein
MGINLTERRDTITRAWRLTGSPARRVADYAEMTIVPGAALVVEVPSENDRRARDIGLRLENWARWATAPGQRIASSQTGAICDRLRRAEFGEEQVNGERRRVDEDDALMIERTMRHLSSQHRLLLWYCYIKQAQPGEVCRRMSIPHQPVTQFIEIFRAAQEAVELLSGTAV